MIKVEKTEKTEKINHYKQIVKSLYLTNIAIQNYNLTQKEKEKKMRKSNCCKAELLPRTVLCSKCLSEVKIEKLTAEDFIKDNVLKLPFKETLSEVRSVACGVPRFNKTLIIKFELDIDGMYVYNLPEDMDKVRVERGASYVVKYGKHVNKIKSLDEVNIMFSIIGNHIVIDSHEFDKLKKSDLVLTFIYAKKNEVRSEKNNVCDREKSLKSFIYNLNIVEIENISKDKNKIFKSNLDFMQLLSYANVNLHVIRFIDLGNGEVYVDFGTGFLPSIGPSVIRFTTKWEYLDQILTKKMVVPISPVPMSKCSLDNLPFPIKIGDKVLFQNRHVLLKYFNIGYHVLNSTFDNKYTIVDICKIEGLFKIIIGDNFNVYESHLLSRVDVFTLFGSDNTLGTIVNPNQHYGREVTPMQQAPYPFGPINVNPGFMKSGQIHSGNMNSMYNLDGMGYFKAMERKMDNVPKETTGKGEKAKINFADESSFFKTDNTEDKKFDKPIKDEKIVPARIDDDNIFSNGDYVTIKYKDLEKGILNGIVKNPFGWGVFNTADDPYVIVHYEINIKNTEIIYVFRKGESYYGFTVEADKAKEIIRKMPLTVTGGNIGEDKVNNTIKPKSNEDFISEYLSKFPLNSEVFICVKRFEEGLVKEYITNNFGLNVDYNNTLKIHKIIVDPESKKITFNLKAVNPISGFTSVSGFTIDADKIKDVMQNLFTEMDGVDNKTSIKTKGRKTNKEKGETKK